MQTQRFSWVPGRPRAGLALTLLPLLSACLGAVALPLLAGGTLMGHGWFLVPSLASAANPSTER